MKTRSRAADRSLALLAAALLLAGCVASREIVVSVPIERGAPADIRAHTDNATVLRSVATLLVTRFALPLTPPIHAYFYPSRDDFERGLVEQARVDASIARDQASYAIGVGTANGILLRGDRFGSVPVSLRIGVIAHELTHVSQYELAGGLRSTSEQWIREGFADWVKYQAIEAFGFEPYASSRAAVARAVRKARASVRLPDLDELAASRAWIAARRKLGNAATYGVAFLAVDRLVQRAGRDAVIGYFRRFAVSTDRDANFAAAFGVARAEFVADVRRDLP